MRASIMPIALARLLLKFQTFKHSRDKSVHVQRIWRFIGSIGQRFTMKSCFLSYITRHHISRYIIARTRRRRFVWMPFWGHTPILNVIMYLIVCTAFLFLSPFHSLDTTYVAIYMNMNKQYTYQAAPLRVDAFFRSYSVSLSPARKAVLSYSQYTICLISDPRIQRFRLYVTLTSILDPTSYAHLSKSYIIRWYFGVTYLDSLS